MNSEMGETVTAGMVKEWILAQGIDLVGIAHADHLILSHPPRPAKALMPTAKSVIVMAVAHSLGSVYAPDIMLWTRSKMQTSRLLDETAEKIGRRLEVLHSPAFFGKHFACQRNIGPVADIETGRVVKMDGWQPLKNHLFFGVAYMCGQSENNGHVLLP